MSTLLSITSTRLSIDSLYSTASIFAKKMSAKRNKGGTVAGHMDASVWICMSFGKHSSNYRRFHVSWSATRPSFSMLLLKHHSVWSLNSSAWCPVALVAHIHTSRDHFEIRQNPTMCHWMPTSPHKNQYAWLEHLRKLSFIHDSLDSPHCCLLCWRRHPFGRIQLMWFVLHSPICFYNYPYALDLSPSSVLEPFMHLRCFISSLPSVALGYWFRMSTGW